MQRLQRVPSQEIAQDDLLRFFAASESNESGETYQLGLCFQMLLHSGDSRAAPELIALAINLTVSPRNGEVRMGRFAVATMTREIKAQELYIIIPSLSKSFLPTIAPLNAFPVIRTM
jgi:hypothetical protein